MKGIYTWWVRTIRRLGHKMIYYGTKDLAREYFDAVEKHDLVLAKAILLDIEELADNINDIECLDLRNHLALEEMMYWTAETEEAPHVW